jgi:hypothetical protein
MRLLLIACGVFRRELEHLAARAGHHVELCWPDDAFHVRPGSALRAEVQARIDAAASDPLDAILVGYGICNGWVRGLRAAAHPLVLPQAWDCLTLLLGSRRRHQKLARDWDGGAFLVVPPWRSVEVEYGGGRMISAATRP